MRVTVWLGIVVGVFYAILAQSLAHAATPSRPSQSSPSPTDQDFADHVALLYRAIGLKAAGLDYKTFELATTGYYALKAENSLSSRGLLSVADFTQASTAKRFYVIDLDKRALVYQTWVAHGKNSGENLARTFSNTPRSHMSSLGFYVTDATYEGQHGLSLYLNGVDRGWNDKARERAIVMHGASYVSEDFIRAYGRLGRSQGCPSLPLEFSEAIIRTIAGRTCLFAYYPDTLYLERSSYLNKHAAALAYRRESERIIAQN